MLPRFGLQNYKVKKLSSVVHVACLHKGVNRLFVLTPYIKCSKTKIS